MVLVGLFSLLIWRKSIINVDTSKINDTNVVDISTPCHHDENAVCFTDDDDDVGNDDE